MVTKLEPEIRNAWEKAMRSNQEVGRLLRYLITPIAVAAYTLAAWRMGSDLNWTGEFFIESGLLSHWQVWLALAIGVHFGGSYLNRVAAGQSSSLGNRAIAS